MLESDEKIKSELDEKIKSESESDAFLNQVSLDYLINTKQYKVY